MRASASIVVSEGRNGVRQGKQAWDWLVQIISEGSGAEGLSVAVWHLALG